MNKLILARLPDKFTSDQHQKIIFKGEHMQVNSISNVVIAGSISDNTNGIDVAKY